MMNIIQRTVAGFGRSASRRMDAELCIVNLCQPELDTDTDGLLARLTRVEEQLKSGVVTAAPQAPVTAAPAPEAKDVPTPAPVITEELPALEVPISQVESEAPVGFWSDVASAVRNEMKTPAGGFFTTSAEAPVKGILQGDKLLLVCANAFAKDIINKPDILELVSRKASAKLGRPVQAVVVDKDMTVNKTKQMEQLLDFGRAHSDYISIKE